MIVALSGVQFLAQGTDPILGTWELNVAKSKYSPGPPPRSQTRTYILAGDAVKATVKGIGSDGKPTSAEWTMSYDGLDRPLNGNPNADTVSLRRVDPYKVEFTLKRAGKVVITGTRTISKDGKTMPLVASGITAAGQNRRWRCSRSGDHCVAAVDDRRRQPPALLLRAASEPDS